MTTLKSLIYVSSTESRHPALRNLGHLSTLPEKHGCDILVINSHVRLGFQRKEASDFISSLSDGRLSKEIGQIETSSVLTHSILILEGSFSWTTDGQSTIPYSNITRTGFRSLIAAIQLRGIIVLFTDSVEDTVNLVTHLTAYLSKSRHSTLSVRPNARSSWGQKTSKSFALHLLQSFPSIGPELADRIYTHFSSSIPIEWTCTEDELQSIPGIGKTLATRLINSLKGT